MTHDTCDYCRRPFGWTVKAICMNCGLENVREAAAVVAPVRETTMLAPRRETAMMPPAKPIQTPVILQSKKKMRKAKRGRR